MKILGMFDDTTFTCFLPVTIGSLNEKLSSILVLYVVSRRVYILVVSRVCILTLIFFQQVAFLNQHNMSFDLWSKQGIPFMLEQQANETLEKYIAKQEATREKTNPEPTVENTIQRRVQLRRSEDIEFFARTMAGLREWLDAAHHHQANNGLEGQSYLLPACNSFLRRALYEGIEKEYPTLVLENAGAAFPNQIRVWRLNPQEKQQRQDRLLREGWEDLILKVGMWRVFEALTRICQGHEISRDSVLFAESIDQVNWDRESVEEQPVLNPKLPVVVHNGFMDILFLLTHFVSDPLPDRYEDCKAMIRQYFPIVYDTKIVTTECSALWGYDMSNLSNIYQRVVRDGSGLESKFHVLSCNENDESAAEDQEHEAAYDAFMTGAVYVGLCNQIKVHQTDTPNDESIEGFGSLVHLAADENDQEVRLTYGRNKLYQMSMYTMDLEEPSRDPLSRGMLPESTYRISGIDPSVSTRDIVRCLSGLHDDTGRKVNFDLVWVDDVTFICAASYRVPQTIASNGTVGVAVGASETTLVLKEHGRLILEALRQRFPTESIIGLDDYLLSLEKEAASNTNENDSWVSRICSLFGFGRTKRKFNGQEEPAAKRRRVN